MVRHDVSNFACVSLVLADPWTDEFFASSSALLQ